MDPLCRFLRLLYVRIHLLPCKLGCAGLVLDEVDDVEYSSTQSITVWYLIPKSYC